MWAPLKRLTELKVFDGDHVSWTATQPWLAHISILTSLQSLQITKLTRVCSSCRMHVCS